MKSGKPKYKSISISNVKIQMYGDAAAATFNAEAKFAPGKETLLANSWPTHATFYQGNLMNYDIKLPYAVKVNRMQC